MSCQKSEIVIVILLEPPYRSEKYSAALHSEQGFEEVSDTQLEAHGYIVPFSLDLKLRSWKLFRVRFQQFLTDPAEAKAKDPTLVKCLRISHQIIQQCCDEKYVEAVPEIKSGIDFYDSKENFMENCLYDPKKLNVMLDDIKELLKSRLSFLLPTESNGAHLKKILSLRNRLFANEQFRNKDLNKKIVEALHHFDGILAEHLLNQQDTELFMKGVKIFNAWALRTKENTSHLVDLFVLGIKNSAQLTDNDKEFCEKLLEQVSIVFQSRKYTKEVEQLIDRALLDILISKTKRISLNRKKNIRGG